MYIFVAHACTMTMTYVSCVHSAPSAGLATICAVWQLRENGLPLDPAQRFHSCQTNLTY